MPRVALRAGLLAWLLAPATVFVPPAVSPARAQFVDRHFAAIPTPPDSGLYPAEVQQAIEEGYRQLALVTGPDDDAHLDPAEGAFERALAIDPKAIHALNGLGIYELTKDEQWLVVLESLKKLFDRDHISMAIEAFRDALEADPAFHAARYNLALAYRQARGEENYQKALGELQRLVREAPATGDAPLLLAVTLRDAGAVESLAEAIESMPEGESFPKAGRQLLLAYSLFASGRDDDAAEAYWSGVEALASEKEADLYWHDVRPIVSPETDAEFQALDLERRKDYLRSFWQGLADQAFVSPDERLAEHYRRLQYAYEHFRLELPERRHYSTGAAYVPPWQTGFDDRGVIWLRHGEPNDQATYSGPEVEQNFSWKYDRPGGDPLVFHFVSDEDVRDFKLVRRLADAVIDNSTKMTGQTIFNTNCEPGGRCDRYDARILQSSRGALRDLYSSRGHLEPYYDRAATNLDRQLLEREESRLAADIAIGTTSQSFTPESSGEPLAYPVYPVAFKDPAGRPEIAFYYALPTSQVTVLQRAGGGNEIDYRYQLLLKSGVDEDPLARQEDDVVVASSSPLPQEPGVMLPRVQRLQLGPGEYRYGMKVTDLNSGRSGVTQGVLQVDDFGSGLSLSGIVLAGRVEPADDAGNPFVRWGKIKVLPLASRMFRRTQPIFVYYEVYGLSSEASGSARYRTTYTLESREPDRNVVARFFSAVGELLSRGEEQGAITYSFERALTDETDPVLEYFSLDVSESTPGEYMLIVEVEDQVSGSTVRKTVDLTLVD